MSAQITAPLEVNPRHIEINLDNTISIAEMILIKLQDLESRLVPVMSNKLKVDKTLDLLCPDNDKSDVWNKLSSVCNVLSSCDLIIVNIHNRLEI